MKDYVRERRLRRREMFVPLSHPPGHAQADFGEADAIIAGVKYRAHFFVMTLPHSDACFVAAYPAATTEAWLDGHNRAFVFSAAFPNRFFTTTTSVWCRASCQMARGNERGRSAGCSPIGIVTLTAWLRHGRCFSVSGCARYPTVVTAFHRSSSSMPSGSIAVSR